MDSEKIVAIILAIFLPPLAVFMKDGLGPSFWLNCLLCIFVWFPGILHALYVVLKDWFLFEEIYNNYFGKCAKK